MLYNITIIASCYLYKFYLMKISLIDLTLCAYAKLGNLNISGVENKINEIFFCQYRYKLIKKLKANKYY